VLTAGMDNDCGNMVSPNNTLAALRLGLISEDLIDKRVGNLFKIRFRLGQFDLPGPLDKITNASAGVCSERALELARDGVAQGTTMLKNDGKTLPLDPAKAGSTKKVAVIGPLLGDRFTSSLSGYYGPLVSCRNAPYW
jgi:beta-glucosidase-like glycosyl hydrolase